MNNMEENRTSLNNEELAARVDNPRRYLKFFVFIFIGQIILIISTINNATTINGVPRFFRYFSTLAYVASILFIITLSKLRSINRDFFRSFLTIDIYLATILFIGILQDTKTPVYAAVGRGLKWTTDFLFVLFYFLYYKATNEVFKRIGHEKGAKVTRFAMYGTLVIFGVDLLFALLSRTYLVMVNRFMNRFFLYGDWGLIALSYIFHFVITLLIYKQFNKALPKKEEVQKDEK
ncbi:MAG: hypothetical protein J6T25_02170 [Bacilli bacterium]|nr:hypothetical protein [Bacilli bacterium]